MRKRYNAGTLPTNPPKSKLLSKMPKNPVVFTIIWGGNIYDFNPCILLDFLCGSSR